MQRIYDRGAALHDPVLAATFRLFLHSTVDSARANILAALGARRGERVLEVGTGTGGNALRLAAAGVNYVGIDLACGMLNIARNRLNKAGFSAVPLALADAHALPFADGSFDRVVHVGAVNSFRDPMRALAEMIRVARDGATLVLVDEELAADAPRLTRWAFRASTFYTNEPCVAPSVLPEGAVIQKVEPLTDFFYLMRAEVRRSTAHKPQIPRESPG